MLTLKTSEHIPTSRNIKGFHSSETYTGFSMCHVEARKVNHENIALVNRNLRRSWLAQQWKEHDNRYRQRKAWT